MQRHREPVEPGAIEAKVASARIHVAISVKEADQGQESKDLGGKGEREIQTPPFHTINFPTMITRRIRDRSGRRAHPSVLQARRRRVAGGRHRVVLG